jgi:hypothetical protein
MRPIVLIFKLHNYGNHCGLYLDELGFYDLSLLGVRRIPLSKLHFASSIVNAYILDDKNLKKTVDFFGEQSKLPEEIIEQERKNKGWHLTKFAGDFVLSLRTVRAKPTQSLNCVEWLLYGLELSGYVFPSSILSPEQLDNWCRLNAVELFSNLSPEDMEFKRRLEEV